MRHIQLLRAAEHVLQLDEMHLPVSPFVGEEVVAVENGESFTRAFLHLALQKVELVDAIDDPVVGHLVSGNPRKRRQHVGVRNPTTLERNLSVGL